MRTLTALQIDICIGYLNQRSREARDDDAGKERGNRAPCLISTAQHKRLDLVCKTAKSFIYIMSSFYSFLLSKSHQE